MAAPTRRDALLAGLLAVALLLDHDAADGGGGPWWLGVLAVGLCCGPLVLRSRAPLPVLAVVVGGVFACLFTLKPVDVVVLPPMLGVYTVVLQGDRVRSILTGTIGVAIALLGVWSASGDLQNGVYNGTLMALAAVGGEAVRATRAFRAEVAERERERDAERARDADRRVSDERLRIAQEVHDVVAHAMVAINVQAGVAAHLIDSRPEQARSALTEIKRTSGAALTDLRATLGLLRGGEAAPVAPTGVLAELPALAAPLRATGIEVSVEVSPEAAALPTAIGGAAHRIVQEALTNVLRHAATRHASVRVAVDAGALHVEVTDDGDPLRDAAPEGHRAVPPGSGNGVRGMRERAAALGGSVEAGPAPGGGWRVAARLPLA